VRQGACLRDALSDVDLGLETIDASIGCVWLCHYTANATPDTLRCEKFWVSYLNTAVFVAACDSDIIVVLVIVEFKSLVLSVDFRFEQHVILFVFLLVDYHLRKRLK
jgi:hypothetical protein